MIMGNIIYSFLRYKDTNFMCHTTREVLYQCPLIWLSVWKLGCLACHSARDLFISFFSVLLLPVSSARLLLLKNIFFVCSSGMNLGRGSLLFWTANLLHDRFEAWRFEVTCINLCHWKSVPTWLLTLESLLQIRGLEDVQRLIFLVSL